MYLSLITAEFMLKERHRDLLAEAEKRHMIRRALEAAPPVPSFWQIRLGDFLIRTGLRLKRRSIPQVRPVPGP